ncbi:hypothetical protein HYW67_02530 [Candidatus Parcubacteria bacterium]|nr:hypothetical protein [Candidatus Parcubacteria bacterium]
MGAIAVLSVEQQFDLPTHGVPLGVQEGYNGEEAYFLSAHDVGAGIRGILFVPREGRQGWYMDKVAYARRMRPDVPAGLVFQAKIHSAYYCGIGQRLYLATLELTPMEGGELQVLHVEFFLHTPPMP